jgi:hypothetical protein
MKVTKDLLEYARAFNEEHQCDFKETVSTKDLLENRVIDWTTFYRRNLDIFATDYLGIRPLAYLQRECLLTLSNSKRCFLICSRGMSKTFTTALYCICVMMLYPGIKIIGTSSSQAQAEEIVKKIKDIFCNDTKKWGSPVLAQMVRDGKITFPKKDGITYVKLSNDIGGGELLPVPCIETSRGKRANITIADECALLKKGLYYQIIEPTREARAFKGRPKDLIESIELQELFLTSARDQTNWIYREFMKTIQAHFKGADEDFFVGDIYSAVANGINTKQKLISAKKRADEYSWLSEYLNIWLGNSKLSLFKYEQFKKIQLLENSFLERTVDDYLDGLKNNTVKVNSDEIRVMAVDVAVAIGKENDNTAIVCGRYNIKTHKLYVDYVKTLNGQNTLTQAIEIKRLFYDYKANYVLLDTMGVGSGLYDTLTKETEDNEIGSIYNAWTVNRENDIRIVSDKVYADKIQRTISNNAEEVIIPIVGNEQLNSDVHLSVRDSLKNESVLLLKDDEDKRSSLETNDKKWLLRTSEYRSRVLLPFLTTRFMINESVSLQCDRRGNKIHVHEKATDTKDLYMSFAYLVYFVFKKLMLRYEKVDSNQQDYEELDEEVYSMWADINY